MAQRLLLVNPTRPKAQSRRRTKPTAKRRKPMAKARRSAAQKAATRKMIAANKRRRNPNGARRRPAARAAAPARRRRPAARAAAPARRRRVRRNPATATRQRQTYARTAQMNPRRRRRIKRNPRVGLGRFPTMNQITNELLMPAAVGAVGAIANDALFTYLPIPAQFKAPGFARYASKGLSAVVMTWLATLVVRRQTAMQLGVGALTTLTAEIARDFMLQNIPALAPMAVEGMGLYTMGYYNPALPAGGGIPANNENLNLYTTGRQTQMLPSLATRETPGVAPGGVGQMVDSHGYNYQ